MYPKRVNLILNKIKNFSWNWNKTKNKVLFSVLFPLNGNNKNKHIKWYLDTNDNNPVIRYDVDEKGKELSSIMLQKIRERLVKSNFKDPNEFMMDKVIEDVNQELQKLKFGELMMYRNHPDWKNLYGEDFYRQFNMVWRVERNRFNSVHNECCDIVDHMLDKKQILSADDKEKIVRLAIKKLEKVGFELDQKLLHKSLYKGFKFKNKEFDLDTIIKLEWNEFFTKTSNFTSNPELYDTAKNRLSTVLTTYVKEILIKEKPELKDNLSAIHNELQKNSTSWKKMLDIVMKEEMEKMKLKNTNILLKNNNNNNNNDIQSTSVAPNNKNNLVNDSTSNKSSNNVLSSILDEYNIDEFSLSWLINNFNIEIIYLLVGFIGIIGLIRGYFLDFLSRRDYGVIRAFISLCSCYSNRTSRVYNPLDIHVENKTLLDTDKTKIDLKDSDRYNKTIKIRKKLMIINNKNELN